MKRSLIEQELQLFQEYSNLGIESLDDSSLEKLFNEHCEKYKETIPAGKVHNIQKTVAIDTPDGYQLLGDYYIKNNKDIFYVTVDGVATKVSGDHKFQTQDGWKPMNTISPTDYIFTKDGYKAVQHIYAQHEQEETYDWNVLHENHRYWTASGLSSHNTGKTFILLNIAREAQKQGYYVIWYDSENAIESEQVESFGIDGEKFRYEPVDTIQKFRTSVSNVLDTLIEQKEAGILIPKLMFILDSAGNLASQKEIDDAKSGSEKSDMSRAKVMKSIFRIVMSKMGIIGSCFCFSNHSYSTLDLFSQQVASGGCLVPGIGVYMADGYLKNIEDIRPGDKVQTLDGDKEILNTWRFEKPTITVEFEDGSSLECSRTHRFFIGNDLSQIFNDDAWVEAQNLIEGQDVTQIMR